MKQQTIDLVTAEFKKVVEENPGQEITVVIRVDKKTETTVEVNKKGETSVTYGPPKTKEETDFS